MVKTRQTWQRISLFSAAMMAISASLSIMPVYADSQVVKTLKYFNPAPEKGYLNKSQDRIIKKKTFKESSALNGDPAQNKQIGIFAYLSPEQAENLDLAKELLEKPSLNGLSAIFAWHQLEPNDGKYNWQPIDKLLDLCKQYNKSLILRVSTSGLDHNASSALDDPKANSDTPQWVFDSGAKSLTYKDTNGKQHLLPVFWDNTYLANWSNFIQDLGQRYDKNPNIHSIGITGGGTLGGTAIIPTFATNDKDGSNVLRDQAKNLEESLKTDYGMNQRQLIQHWKYVADIFPKAFPTARLNFDVEAPVNSRAGQDALDEISNYLLFRYGERIFLTRQNIDNGKHGFDQWRVLVKFRGDTLTGYALTDTVDGEALQKIAKYALDDGVSYAEVPAKLVLANDEAITKPLSTLASHIGFEIVAREANIPKAAASGEPLKVSFTFANLGDAPPMRPSRQFDKDIPESFKVALTFYDKTGKPQVVSLHTPHPPTTSWSSGKPVSWETDLKMPEMAPGEYSVSLSLVNPDSKEPLQLIDGLTGQDSKPETALSVGTITIQPARELGASPNQAQ